MLLFKVKTGIRWINDIAKTPILGGVFLFGLTFIPAVLSSLVLQALIPQFKDDIGFTKLMLAFLPGWNLLLWLKKIKLYMFFLPTWVLLGGIAIIKAILLITGLDNGQT